MRCPRCQAENPDGARFCEDCGARLQITCATCGQPVGADKRFCRSCGAPLSTQPARFAAPDSYTPRHLAERILTSGSALEGERKQVTVLLADLKGSMELLADRDPEDARKLRDPVLEHMMGSETTRRAIDVRLALSHSLIELGQVARIAGLLEEARQLAEALGDRLCLARVLHWVAICDNLGARYPEALDAGRRALAISTAAADADLRVKATYGLATARVLSGDIRVAVDLYTPLVDGADAGLARRIVSISGTIFIGSCSWLGCCWAYLGDFERALAYAERGLEEAEAIGVPLAQAAASAWRAFPMMLRGEATQALPWLERAVRLSETNGPVLTFAMASGWLGWALAMSEHHTEALPALERGVHGLEDTGVRTAISFFHTLWAQALLLAGQREAAERMAERALELAVSRGERVHHAMALEIQADIESTSQPLRADLAASLYDQAAALACDVGLRPVLAHCHLGLGKLYRRTGEQEQAREHLSTAAEMYREMGMRFYLEQAEAEMCDLGRGRS